MQMFSSKLDNWVRCLIARNPLVRVSDRVEAAGLLVVIALALLVVPLAGATGTAVHDSLSRQYAVERVNRQAVSATVTADSAPARGAYEVLFVTPIRWEYARVEHTAEVRTSYMRQGERMSIWVDTNGDRTTRRLSDQDAATEAVVAGFGLWFATVGVATAVWTVLRLRLEHARYAAWDRELADLADNDGRTNRNA